MKIVTMLLTLLIANAASADLNIYTDRSATLIEPIAVEFTARTGEKVNILSVSYKDLIKRLEIQGEKAPADLIFVKDMVYLSELTKKNMFQPMTTDVPSKVVAPAMRHPQGLWAAITIRPRTIVYSTDAVTPEELTTYEDLASPKWKGKLCVRTSASSYNVALVSSFITNLGYEPAKTMMQGWMDNLAEEPFSNDRAVLDAILNGSCDVGVVNSYYLAGKVFAAPNYAVGIKFANQSGRGVHVNGIGAGVFKFSKKADLASAFIALMLEDKSQLHFTSSHLDYPAKMQLLPQTLIQDWGVFQADQTNWSVFGLQNTKAKELFEAVGYE